MRANRIDGRASVLREKNEAVSQAKSRPARPGLLGEAEVNIAGMQVARRAAGGQALMVLTVDSAIPDATLEEITRAVGAVSTSAVYLPES